MRSGSSKSTADRRQSLGKRIASFSVIIWLCGVGSATAVPNPNCLAGEWIDDVIAFVVEETGSSVPMVCLSRATSDVLQSLVATEGNHDILAAVFVPARREILLADDLDLGAPLGRSYLVHELVHAQQFAGGSNERARCPGALESDAYGVQALYLRRHNLTTDAFLLQVLGMLQSACGRSNY